LFLAIFGEQSKIRIQKWKIGVTTNRVKKANQRPPKKLTGGCSCGQVRYQLVDKPIRVHCCHCSDCQRHTGSAFVLNAIIETAAIKILRGKLQAVPVPRGFGPHDIYRCPKCKVALWSAYGRGRPIRFVRVGTLDHPSTIRPDIHIYTETKLPWVKLPKGTPAFRQYYDLQKVWPLKSRQRLKLALATQKQNGRR
jgi:hypothetical protein